MLIVYINRNTTQTLMCVLLKRDLSGSNFFPFCSYNWVIPIAIFITCIICVTPYAQQKNVFACLCIVFLKTVTTTERKNVEQINILYAGVSKRSRRNATSLLKQ